MFERLTSILAKIGIPLHPSVIYREFTSQAPAPEIGLPDCTWEFAAAAEMQELAQVPAYGISLDELYERLGERAECFVLRHRGSIIAFTWCQLDGPPRRSEEHTSELQSLMRISYAVFCLKKKTEQNHNTHHTPIP